MTELWYPPADRSVPATSDAGPFQGGAPKTLLHTTESDTAAPAFGVFRSKGYWPHFTASVETGAFHIWQHIPIDKAAKALQHPSGTGITNTDNVIQIEIVWRAANAANMPTTLLDGLRDWIRWVEANHGTAHQAQPFPGPRLDWPTWDAYSGIVGHVHCPSNTHVDPGAINVAYLLANPDPQLQPQEEESMALVLSTDGESLELGVGLNDGVPPQRLDPEDAQGLAAAGVKTAHVSKAMFDRFNAKAEG